jgi:hypothetical protein
MFSWISLDLVTVCAFAVACAFVGLVGLVAQRLVKRSRRPRVEIGLLAVVGLLGLAGLGLAVPALWVPCLGVLAIGAFLALFRIAFLARLGTIAQAVLGHAAAVWVGLLLLGATTLVLQMVELERQMAPSVFAEDSLLPPISPLDVLQPVQTQWAATDTGRTLPLFTIPLDSKILPPDGDSSFLSRRHLETALIRTAEADTRYNCHGYVFTGGRFWVRGSHIEQLLKDNGYRSTTNPLPGDIIVYRENATGLVSHTGLVRTVIEDTGKVLIESKLGSYGRFIHAADQHPYDNTTATYYHTVRGGHLLHGLDGVRGPSSTSLVSSSALPH